MAERLARLFGTEEDKVNCSFFFKIGACRHAEKCTRLHYKPPISQTLLIPHMYDQPPLAVAIAEGQQVPEEEAKAVIRHFEDFYEEVFLGKQLCKRKELTNFGEVEDLIVCNNLGEHIMGNVYAKFRYEEDAEKCLQGLNGRYYSGKLVTPEFSPVTDFRESLCRQYEEGACSRGGYCNFMHMKEMSRSFKRSLYRQMYDEHPEFRDKRYTKRSRSRSRSNKNKKKDKKSHKDRDRSHDRHKKDKKKDNKDEERKEMTSEERRAMIASWNAEPEQPTQN